MKKTQKALQGKPYRLSLNRETIQILNEPALLELARGEAQNVTVLSGGGLGCQIVTGSGNIWC